MSKRAWAVTILLGLLSVPAYATEEWRVVRDGTDGWSFNKSALAKNEQTGFMHVQVGRFYGAEQTEDNRSFQFEIRRYQVECGTKRTRQLSSERYTVSGGAVSSKPADPNAPWVPATFGWPLKASAFACDAVASQAGASAPSKISAMAVMKTIATAQASATSNPTSPTTEAEFCKSIKRVLGDGQKETPFFNSFYKNASERNKYTGQGSVKLEGFGDCKIAQTNTPPGRLGPVFASYYCTKVDGSLDDNARFAEDASAKIATCLPTGTLSVGNDMGQSIKTYTHAVTMAGFPRVRVQHTTKAVTIYLDAK